MNRPRPILPLAMDEMEELALYFMENRFGRQDTIFQLHEVTREFCRTVVCKCGAAVELKPLETFWIVETRAQIKDPGDVSIDASGMGKKSMNSLDSLITGLTPNQILLIKKKDLPHVKCFMRLWREHCLSTRHRVASDFLHEFQDAMEIVIAMFESLE